MKDKMNSRFRTLKGSIFPPGMAGKSATETGPETTVDSMSAADPFSPEPSLFDSVQQAMRQALAEGVSEHYAPAALKYELHELIAAKFARRTGLAIDPAKNVLITPGSDAAIFFALMPFIEEGDEVLVPDPIYPKFYTNPELLCGKTVTVPLREKENYQLRIEDLENRCSPRTKMMVLCQPNNPSTTVHRREKLRALSRFIIEKELVLLSDQAFEDHIYDGIEFVSPAALPGMWDRTITVCSASKGLGLSGFRIGFIIAHEEIMSPLQAAAGNVMGSPSSLSMAGTLAAMKDPQFLNDIRIRLERRRNLAYEILHDIPGVFMRPAESGMLSWVNVSALASGEEAARYLKAHAGVEVSAGEQFGAGGAGHLRIASGSFGDEKKAAEVLKRIREALLRLGKEKNLQEV